MLLRISSAKHALNAAEPRAVVLRHHDHALWGGRRAWTSKRRAFTTIDSDDRLDAEAKPEWIQKVPGLNDYQDLLINKVPGNSWDALSERWTDGTNSVEIVWHHRAAWWPRWPLMTSIHGRKSVPVYPYIWYIYIIWYVSSSYFFFTTCEVTRSLGWVLWVVESEAKKNRCDAHTKRPSSWQRRPDVARGFGWKIPRTEQLQRHHGYLLYYNIYIHIYIFNI